MSYRICRPTSPILWFYPRAYNRRLTAYQSHWRLTNRRVLRHPRIWLRKYHYPQCLSWPSYDCYSQVQVLKDGKVVRLCGLHSRAASVTYLLYRYSIVKDHGAYFFAPHLYEFLRPIYRGFSEVFENFSKIFLFQSISGQKKKDFAWRILLRQRNVWENS